MLIKLRIIETLTLFSMNIPLLYINIRVVVVCLPWLTQMLTPLQNDTFWKDHMRHELKIFVFRGKVMFGSWDLQLFYSTHFYELANLWRHDEK